MTPHGGLRPLVVSMTFLRGWPLHTFWLGDFPAICSPSPERYSGMLWHLGGLDCLETRQSNRRTYSEQVHFSVSSPMG